MCVWLFSIIPISCVVGFVQRPFSEIEIGQTLCLCFYRISMKSFRHSFFYFYFYLFFFLWDFCLLRNHLNWNSIESILQLSLWRQKIFLIIRPHTCRVQTQTDSAKWNILKERCVCRFDVTDKIPCWEYRVAYPFTRQHRCRRRMCVCKHKYTHNSTSRIRKSIWKHVSFFWDWDWHE